MHLGGQAAEYMIFEFKVDYGCLAKYPEHAYVEALPEIIGPYHVVCDRFHILGPFSHLDSPMKRRMEVDKLQKPKIRFGRFEPRDKDYNRSSEPSKNLSSITNQNHFNV